MGIAAAYRAGAPSLRGLLYGVAFLLMHITLAAAILILVDVAFWRRLPSVGRKAIVLMGLFAFSTLTGLIITHFSAPNPMFEKLALAMVFLAIMAFILGAERRPEDLRRILLTCILTVLVGNFLGEMAGLGASSLYLGRSQNMMLAGLGYFFRTQYPFTFGINSYGTLLGLFIVVATVDLISKRSWLALACICLSAFELAMTDSRGALVAAAISVPIAIFSLRGRTAVAATIASFVSVPTLMILAGPVQDVFGGFSRQGVDVTSGRLYWWQLLLDRLPGQVESWWLGFGLAGTSSLNISMGSLKQFEGYRLTADALPGAHNLWLQAFLDGGFFKIIVLLVLFVTLFNSVKNFPVLPKRMALCVVYVPLVGIMESSFDSSRFEMLFIIFSLVGMAFAGQFAAQRQAVKDRPDQKLAAIT